MANYKAKVVHIHCRLCDYVQTYVDDGGTKEPEECPRCHTRYDEVKFVSITNEEMSLTTHFMVRWGCRWCKHHGVMWLHKKNSKVRECPHCGHENGGGLRVRKIDSKGDCDTIWKPVEGITRPLIKTKLPKKRFRCDNCGYTHSYLIRKPKRCQRCGQHFEEGQNVQAQGTTT